MNNSRLLLIGFACAGIAACASSADQGAGGTLNELERLPGYFVRMQLRGFIVDPDHAGEPGNDIVPGSLPDDPITVRSVIGKWFAGGTYVTTTISTDWGDFDLGFWNRSGLHLIDADTLLPEIKTEHRWVKDMPQMKV